MELNKKTHISILKKDDMPFKKKILIRLIALLTAFILSICLSSLIIKDNPFKITSTFFKGAFIMPWRLLFDSAILLGFGISIVPAFKMKYWNMGATGQVLIGCLTSCVIMFYLGKDTHMSTFPMIILMLLGSIITSIVWAIIPALFKAFFNTNETLFTLMMNYVAIAIVNYINCLMTQGKQETVGVINLLEGKRGWLQFNVCPKVIDANLFIPILVLIGLAVAVYFYMTKTVDGFEISVLGDSPATAKYSGMNNRLIIIRTLIVSGIITGIIGFLYASAIDHSISSSTSGSLGFTGILVAWLANFNPLIMGAIAFFLSIISNGTSKISSVYHLGSNNLSNVITGIIFFSILISEFLIRYRICIIHSKKEEKEVN